nr:hypothetical protein Iba_scaffold18241CG0010 [Ipomoea batatas]
MLGGAIWRRTPAVALNSGMTSINTVPETNPMQRTSAFFTLELNNQEARIKPALQNKSAITCRQTE